MTADVNTAILQARNVSGRRSQLLPGQCIWRARTRQLSVFKPCCTYTHTHIHTHQPFWA